MCVIVDMNVAHKVFSATEDTAFGTVQRRLQLFGKSKSTLTIAYGGKLAEEYLKDRGVARIVRILDAEGRATQFSTKAIEGEESNLSRKRTLTSNDRHVIALARVSGARVLLSDDNNLCADFLRKDLIDSPRGNIYRNHHDHLLARCKKC
jgi:hypothetical protein